MSETVTLADVERLCWRLSGWKVEQRSVDELLAAVTAYAGYGPDDRVETEGAPALATGGGEGEPVRSAETLPAPEPVLDVPEAPTGAQTGVQRIEVTGTLTLVCGGMHTPARAPAPRNEKGRFAPVPRAAVTGGRRVCSKCQQSRPVEDFSRDAKGTGGRRYACRDCENTRKREARRAKAAGQ